VDALRLCPGHACPDPLRDQRLLELGKAGNDVEHQLADGIGAGSVQPLLHVTRFFHYGRRAGSPSRHPLLFRRNPWREGEAAILFGFYPYAGYFWRQATGSPLPLDHVRVKHVLQADRELRGYARAEDFGMQ